MHTQNNDKAPNDNIKLHISGTHSITGIKCQYRTPRVYHKDDYIKSYAYD